jgi:diadenylate cyclase
MDRIFTIFLSIGSDDLVDIIAVSIVFFIVFTLLRESRSFTALRGLVAVMSAGLFVWIVARLGNLTATQWMLERSTLLIVVVFVILFQNELKKALTDFGQTSIFRPFLQSTHFDLDEIIKAVVRMSERKVGALIAIERRNSLKPYIDVGTMIDSEVSAELIRTIFQVGTPLHDGAVVISNNRLAAAACLLPLSESPRLSKDLGTRHRAGIGLTEETDAIAVICSEETGIISLACNGKIERNETVESLRNKLKHLLDFQEDLDG